MAPPAATRTARASRIGTVSGGAAGRLAGGRPLFFFHGALAVDAIARERQRFEPLLADGLAAALAVAEVAVVELLKRGGDVLQLPPLTVPQSEQEFTVVCARGLVAQVLDRVVLGPLPVLDVLAHLVRQLAMPLLQLFPEVGQAFLPHRDLLLADSHAARPVAVVAEATMPPQQFQSLWPLQRSTESSGASPHSRASP